MAHPWPGNVRELKNVVERAVYRAGTPAADRRRPVRSVRVAVSSGPGAPSRPRRSGPGSASAGRRRDQRTRGGPTSARSSQSTSDICSRRRWSGSPQSTRDRRRPRPELRSAAHPTAQARPVAGRTLTAPNDRGAARRAGSLQPLSRFGGIGRTAPGQRVWLRYAGPCVAARARGANQWSALRRRAALVPVVSTRRMSDNPVRRCSIRGGHQWQSKGSQSWPRLVP